MMSIKGHFDGNAIVLDEPITLAVGQAVRIIVEPGPQADTKPAESEPWKGKFRIIDDSDDVILDHFKDYLP